MQALYVSNEDPTKVGLYESIESKTWKLGEGITIAELSQGYADTIKFLSQRFLTSKDNGYSALAKLIARVFKAKYEASLKKIRDHHEGADWFRNESSVLSKDTRNIIADYMITGVQESEDLKHAKAIKNANTMFKYLNQWLHGAYMQYGSYECPRGNTTTEIIHYIRKEVDFSIPMDFGGPARQPN